MDNIARGGRVLAENCRRYIMKGGFVHRWFIEPRNELANTYCASAQDTYPDLFYLEKKEVLIGTRSDEVPAWDCGFHKKIVKSIHDDSRRLFYIYREGPDGIARRYDFAKEHKRLPEVKKASELKE
jgi:predicted oxidoreductase